MKFWLLGNHLVCKVSLSGTMTINNIGHYTKFQHVLPAPQNSANSRFHEYFTARFLWRFHGISVLLTYSYIFETFVHSWFYWKTVTFRGKDSVYIYVLQTSVSLNIVIHVTSIKLADIFPLSQCLLRLVDFRIIVRGSEISHIFLLSNIDALDCRKAKSINLRYPLMT